MKKNWNKIFDAVASGAKQFFYRFFVAGLKKSLRSEGGALPILGVSLIITGILFLVPTGYEGAVQFKDAEKCRAKIESVDNSRIIDTGLIRTGQQVCEIKFLSGKFKGKTAEGWNLLSGSLAQDKIFYPGDVAQVIVHHNENEIISANLIDNYRLHGELILAVAFAVFTFFPPKIPLFLDPITLTYGI